MAVSLVLIACSPPAERLLLEQFFAASRLRDKTALQPIATVIFEPREQGTIAAFDITQVATRREGERELKDVTFYAPVRLPSRATVQQTLVVRMEKIGGRWLITSIKPSSLTTQNN